MKQRPSYELDISSLHSAVQEWLPGNPVNNPLVRPNQETVQLYLQTLEYGFACNLTHRMARLSENRRGQSGDGDYYLVLSIDYHGQSFDARNFNPYEMVEAHCNAQGIDWNWGDPLDMAIGHQMMFHLIEMARTIPNLEMARDIDQAFSDMQGDYMDDNTVFAGDAKSSGGRL